MDAVKNFLHAPIQSYHNLLNPGPYTATRLYKTSTVVGGAAVITAIATSALFLLGPTFITLSTALLLKKICIIGGITSCISFLGGFSAQKAAEGDAFWGGIYSGAVVAVTIVPAILLAINAALLLKNAHH